MLSIENKNRLGISNSLDHLGYTLDPHSLFNSSGPYVHPAYSMLLYGGHEDIMQDHQAMATTLGAVALFLSYNKKEI